MKVSHRTTLQYIYTNKQILERKRKPGIDGPRRTSMCRVALDFSLSFF